MGNAIVRTAAIQITKRHNHRKCDHKDIYFDLVFIIYLIKNADLSCLMEVASFIASHTVCFVQFHEQNFDQFKFKKKKKKSQSLCAGQMRLIFESHSL